MVQKLVLAKIINDAIMDWIGRSIAIDKDGKIWVKWPTKKKDVKL